MKFAGIGAALLALPLLASGAAHAQTDAARKFEDEASRQQAIYQSKGEERPRGYVIGRVLAAYADALPREFDLALARLGPNERWLDIGAGEGRAILDYYAPPTAAAAQAQNSGKAQSVAISIEDRRTFDWHQTAARLDINKIRYYYGKSLNDYTLEELGKFEIITDMIGGFSYTRDLSRFMEKTLGFLQVNGSFYSLLQDVHAEQGANAPYYPNAPYLTEIVNADGGKTKICEWLKSISCVQVTCDLKPRWTPPVEVYRVHKTCDNVVVPKLTPVHFAAGTPPERRFQLTTTKPVKVENAIIAK